jgi:DNA primase
MPGIDFSRLRGQLSLTLVFELINFTATTRTGPEWRGPCPVHGSRSPSSRSFAANVHKNCWRCFVCGAGGNALDLYAGVTRLPIFDAALEVCVRLQLPVPWRITRAAAASRRPP